MQPIKQQLNPLLLLIFLLLLGCDPLAPMVTPQVIIVTPVPSSTPVPTSTPTRTNTPIPTPTVNTTPSATPYPCEEEGGRVLAFDDFRSEIAGENLRYRVYVPPCYVETQKRYPYVILLHGANYSETQWDELGIDEAIDQGIRLGAVGPMLVFMPFTGRIGNQNTFPPDDSYETVMLDEFLPAIERNFCTWNDREHRAIGGISRGGFWAFSLALRHPDKFGVMGGHSAFFPEDLTEVPSAFNPLELALNSSFLEDAELRMYLDNGANDFAGINLELFSSRLSSRGIRHTYIINPVGEHNDEYWAAHVSEYVAFYGREWPKTLTELPSCLEPSP